MHRRVNPPASDWQTHQGNSSRRGSSQKYTSQGHFSRGGVAGLAQAVRERIRRGEVPPAIQDIIGPIDEKDIDTVIEVLEALKGEGTTFEDLTPEEKQAFARAYLSRTEERRSGFGGALVLGALVAVGGAIWYQSRAPSEKDATDPKGE